MHWEKQAKEIASGQERKKRLMPPWLKNMPRSLRLILPVQLFFTSRSYVPPVSVIVIFFGATAS